MPRYQIPYTVISAYHFADRIGGIATSPGHRSAHEAFHRACFSESFGGGDADMLRGDDGALFAHGGKHGAAGEDAGSPEYSSRALVERRDGVVGEELGLSAGDGEMMGDIGGHVIALEGLKAAAARDARSEGPRGVEEELVDEGGLSREDDGEERAGVEVASPELIQICLRSSMRDPEVATRGMTQYCEGWRRETAARSEVLLPAPTSPMGCPGLRAHGIGHRRR